MIIGICGKFGSGKSYIAQHLSKETGIPIFHFDKFIVKKLMRPGIKQVAQWKLGKKLSLGYGHLLSNLGSLERTLRWYEKMMILRWGNKALRKLMKKGDPVIIDFFGLPISKHFDRFAYKVLVVSDDGERKMRLIERNGFTTEQASNIDKVAADIVDYSEHKFDYVIENDYISLPPAVRDLEALLVKDVS